MSEEGKKAKAIQAYESRPKKKIIADVKAVYTEVLKLRAALDEQNRGMQLFIRRPLVRLQMRIDTTIAAIQRKIMPKSLQK